LHHLCANLARFAVTPSVEHLFRVARHHRRVRHHALAMKRRLRQLSLPPPEFAFARQQAVAEHAVAFAQVRALDELRALRDQDFFNQAWPVKEIDGKLQESESRRVAVLALRAYDEVERLMREIIQRAKQCKALWPGRERGVRH